MKKNIYPVNMEMFNNIILNSPLEMEINLDIDFVGASKDISTEFIDTITKQGTICYNVTQEDITDLDSAIAQLAHTSFIEGDLLVIDTPDGLSTMSYLYIHNKGWLALGGSAAAVTTDYRILNYKPSINGTTLVGNYNEIDPTVPSWAKTESKPKYESDEIGAVPQENVVTESELDLMFLQIFNI